MHLFDHDILFKPDGPLSFAGHITNNWSVNGIPDGGYLMAILAKAMMQHSEMKATPIITANFLNRCEPGDAEILIEKLSASRQFQRFQGSLRQNGKEKIRAFGTFGDENKDCLLESREASCPGITRFSASWMFVWIPCAQVGCRENCPTNQKVRDI